MNDLPICPCEGFIHPQVIFNPPGRNTISYRVGDYTTFREALLLPLKDRNGKVVEQELINWHPSAKGDLALQMVEWWAYVTDILTFYNERIANQAYLRTADLPESLQRLIRILGYRPRPGIGAKGTVAAIANGPNSFTLPQGFQIQSKPGPGKQPQIFELDADTSVNPLDTVAVDVVSPPALTIDGVSVLLKGAIASLKVGDELLLLANSWDGSNDNYQVVTVQNTTQEKDPQGKSNTRVTFKEKLPDKALATDYRLLKSSQSAFLWPHKTAPTVITNENADLDSIYRQIKLGDPVLFESLSTSCSLLLQITCYQEQVWYANAQNSDPSNAPNLPNIPVPILHTEIGFTSSTQAGILNNDRYQVVVRFGWQDVGQLIATPTKIFSSIPPTLQILSATEWPTNSGLLPLLLEDTDGKGIAFQGSLSTTPDTVNLSGLPNAPVTLKPPLQILFNLLSVSRGQTVSNEILGSGDASLAGQEFKLQKSPLTYLLSGDSSSGNSYKSTLQVWVNGVKWKEVPSFYGQARNASIFVTREDENNNTLVQFGDGVNGARLPSGVNNVVATYRYGSGKDAPDVGTLNVIVKSYPNLKAIHNPVPVGGGADPDPPQQIRRYAPQSVLTFGRAVSGDDYEAIAAQAPGVARAKAYWTWDPNEQRTLVLIYVGDDASAVNSAKVALRNAADPNRPVQVKQAISIPIKLILNLRIDSSYVTTTVVAAVMTALLDADTGLFGINAIGISQSIYQSQIYATCQSVPGVIAVHGLQFWATTGNEFILDARYRHDPGEGKFYQLSVGNLTIAPEGT